MEKLCRLFIRAEHKFITGLAQFKTKNPANDNAKIKTNFIRILAPIIKFICFSVIVC
jgi:hypothetical protein